MNPRSPFLQKTGWYVDRKGIALRLGERLSDESRIRVFWTLVRKSGEDECWLWQGGFSDRNYGRFRFGGRAQYAHRLSWIFINGPVPRGIFVLHSCDNPPCCNPKHLWLGTNEDNIADRTRKGRTVASRGCANPMAKLSAEQVREILQSQEKGVALARKFGVNKGIISKVRLGRTYKPEAALCRA
jgi:hypothetical protein